MDEYQEREVSIGVAQVRSWISALTPPDAGEWRNAPTSCRGENGASSDCPVSNAFPSDSCAEGAEAALVSHLRALEDLKSAAAAAQARAAMALDSIRRRTEAAVGVPMGQRGRGVGAEVALARRESPHQGSRLLGLARTLVTDMPRTLRALETGTINEWRATLIVRETICLSAENRQKLDAELAADTGALEGAGSQGLTNRARRIAYRLEPAAAVARARKAVSERHVSCRPAPDTMAYLSALLPAAEAISALAALSGHADTQISSGAGSGLGRGQLMADALVERLTGTTHGIQRVEVQLVMTDRSLLQGDSEPALLAGYGPVPAQYARDLLRSGDQRSIDTEEKTSKVGRAAGGVRGSTDTALGEATAEGEAPGTPGPARTAGVTGNPGAGVVLDPAAHVWIRRLYTAPESGQLVAMDSRARLFPPGLRRLIAARDTTCRTPYCDAPIRHIDHIVPWRQSGSTTFDNGQGLCESCNYVKESPGWASESRPGRSPQEVERRTPTGHTYVSIAPPLPGTILPSPSDTSATAAHRGDLTSSPGACPTPDAIVIGRGLPEDEGRGAGST